MRSPCRAEFVSDLDRTKTLRAPSLVVGAEPSRWGHPYWVVWRFSAHSIGTKAASVHLSLVASRWGPLQVECVFSHSIVTKSALDIWSVFLQDGVTPVGSGSDDLISIEGITTVGLLGAFSPARPRGVFVSSFGRPVCSEARWVPHSVVFTSGEDSVCIPLTNEGVGLRPSSSGPVASRPPLGIGLLRRPRGDSFRLGVSCAGLPLIGAC